MDNPVKKQLQKAAPEPRTFAQFLETSPPGAAEEVRGISILDRGSHRLAQPDLQLYCGDDQCDA
jgi:hypothetical protein